ncbi:MAG: hypothetical protein ABID63_00055 [Pseudomonadota bacterium]
MEFHLDYSLKASADIEYESLYKWCIREIDENGNQVGRDQIPWVWGLYFSISELFFSYDIEGDGRDVLKSFGETFEENSEKITIKNSEKIVARLKPQTVFSMLGVKREIRNFTLNIRKGDEEDCTIMGGVSYTIDIDFCDQTEDDFVVVYLTVTPKKFDAISELIKLNCLNEAQLMLSRVHGFYADWSPGISTQQVKVLTRGKEQAPEIPDGFEFKPPRLGHVGEFRLHLGARQRLVVQDEKLHDL